MIKYAKVINEQTGLCEVGIGTNSKFYKSIGMNEQDVSQSDIDGKWYLSDKCPMKSPEDKLAEAKQAKLNEASNKAYSFENKDALITVSATNMMSRSSETYHIEATLTNNIKLSAYAQALDESETLPWNTKENVNVLLNKAACTTLTELMSQLNAKLWTVDFPTFLAQIEAAQTVEDVEAIEIVYKNPEEIIDVNVSTEKEEVSDENTPDNDIPEVQEDSDIQEDTAGEIE